METLTKRQNEILTYIKEYIVSHGYPPTIREIGKAMGVNSPATIHAHLNNLEKKGAIKKDDSKNRAIELLVDNEFMNHIKFINEKYPERKLSNVEILDAEFMGKVYISLE